MSIAFLVADFPKPSETFISRELLTLRKLGMDVRPYAFRGPDEINLKNLDPGTRQLAAGVGYLSRGQLVNRGMRVLPSILGSWRANNLMQSAVTCKSNPHLRLFRAACLAQQFQAEGIRHLHAHWPYATQIAWLVHRLTGISFSVSIHAHEVEYDYGHFPKIFEDLSFATFCNRAAMERLWGRLPASARAKSHLIYHGVDLTRFVVQPFPESAKPLRVISAGRLTRTKGFDRLVRACARYHAEGGAVELTILGQGHLEAELPRLADQSGFAAHLHLPGWLPHDQVASRMAESHIFALLADTEFGDGLPNVVIEAMASARPVILSPMPAVGEAVTQEVEGFVLREPNDEQGFAEILHNFANAPNKLVEMGRAARRRIETAFDENVHARRLMELFEQRAGITQMPMRPMAA